MHAILLVTCLFLDEASYEAANRDVVGDQLTVRLAPGVDQAAFADAAREQGAIAIELLFPRPPRGWRDARAASRAGLECWQLIRFATARADLQEVRARLAQCDGVECCTLVVRGTMADTVPDDPEFPSQWALKQIQGPRAWDLATEATHTVAVVDTGAELSHRDLVANLWQHPGEIANNGIDDDGNGFVDDVVGWDFGYDDKAPEDRYGHGTHCSGIIGARGNNTRQVTGVCFRVPLMVVKISDNDAQTNDVLVAKGIVYAADNGASVLSMSIAFGSSTDVLQGAIRYAAGLDCVLVAAAGNGSSTSKNYPAAYDEVMGIIATDGSDDRASYSSYGDWCDMAAPGDNILSLGLFDSTTRKSGSSMATPHVAGAAALARTANASLDAIDTRLLLDYSARDRGAAGFDAELGWGRLDLFAALQRARSLRIERNSAHPGESVGFDLLQPDAPGFAYVLLASRFGRAPGFGLAAFDAADHRQVPLNPDPWLFAFVTGNPASSATCMRFVGTLDPAGAATAVLALPRDSQLIGLDLSFAFLTFDPADLAHVSSVSTSVALAVR